MQAASDTKRCYKCGSTLPLSSFCRDSSKKDGLHGRCKPCHYAVKRDWKRRNPEKYRADNKRTADRWALQWKYGLSREDYNAMSEDQGGVCKLCSGIETSTRNGKVKALAVDHCHASGVVRGLLCTNCNVMLGHAKDDPELLRRAAEYLERDLNPSLSSGLSSAVVSQ